MRVEESVEIGRTPQDVWEVTADPRRDPEWCSKVKSDEPDGERRWRVIHRPIPLRPAVELVVEQLEAGTFRRGVRRDVRAQLRALKALLDGSPDPSSAT